MEEKTDRDPKYGPYHVVFVGEEEVLTFTAATWYDTATPAQWCERRLREIRQRVEDGEEIRILSDGTEYEISSLAAFISWVSDVFSADVPWDFARNIK